MRVFKKRFRSCDFILRQWIDYETIKDPAVNNCSTVNWESAWDSSFKEGKFYLHNPRRPWTSSIYGRKVSITMNSYTNWVNTTFIETRTFIHRILKALYHILGVLILVQKKNLRLMILESKMITWQTQKIQNSCSIFLQPMRLPAFDFILRKKNPPISSSSRL